MLLNIAFKFVSSFSRSPISPRRHSEPGFRLEVLEARTVMSASLPVGCDPIATSNQDLSDLEFSTDEMFDIEDNDFELEYDDEVVMLDEFEESAWDAELDALCETSEFDTDDFTDYSDVVEDVLAYTISADETDLYSAEITVLDQDLDEVATDDFLFELDDYLMERFAGGADFALEEGLVEFFVLDESTLADYGIDSNTDSSSLQATLDAYGITDRDNAYDFVVITSDDGFEVYDIPNSDIAVVPSDFIPESSDTDVEAADLSPLDIEPISDIQIALGTPSSDSSIANDDTVAAANDTVDSIDLAETIAAATDLGSDTLIAASTWSPHASTDGQWLATSDAETNQAVLSIIAALVRTKSTAVVNAPELVAIQRAHRQSAIEELAQIQFNQASNSQSEADAYALPSIQPRLNLEFELPRANDQQIDRAFGDQHFSVDSLQQPVDASTSSEGEFSYSQIASMIGMTLVAGSGCLQISRRNGWWLIWRTLRAWSRAVCCQ